MQIRNLPDSDTNKRPPAPFKPQTAQGDVCLLYTSLQAANVLAVGDVELLLSLLAGQNCLVAVDDNDVIAAIDIGGVVRCV